MFKEEYAKMYRLETTHWYFVSKRLFIDNMIKKIRLLDNAKVLDIGCGTGINISTFFKNRNYLGVDVSPDAINFCKNRGLTNVISMDANNIETLSGQYDCICAFDVLYHNKINLNQTLNNIYKLLRPGGYLIITDSAFNFLMSEHDVVMEARERFTTKSLSAYLQQAHLVPIYNSYAFFLLFPLVATVRLIKKLFLPFKNVTGNRLTSDVSDIDSGVNKILIYINKLESFFQKKIPMPWGSTILCIARKEAEGPTPSRSISV